MATPELTPLAAAVLRVDRAPERALAIECGEGDGALFLAREFPAARVRGLDRSAERVRAATARVGLDPEGRIAFKRGRPRALPFPDDFFDLVAQLGGRPSPAELARVLRPGGQLILVCGPMATRSLSRCGRRRFARRGMRFDEDVDAGDGSFSVARLRSGERERGED